MAVGASLVHVLGRMAALEDPPGVGAARSFFGQRHEGHGKAALREPALKGADTIPDAPGIARLEHSEVVTHPVHQSGDRAKESVRFVHSQAAPRAGGGIFHDRTLTKRALHGNWDWRRCWAPRTGRVEHNVESGQPERRRRLPGVRAHYNCARRGVKLETISGQTGPEPSPSVYSSNCGGNDKHFPSPDGKIISCRHAENDCHR